MRYIQNGAIEFFRRETQPTYRSFRSPFNNTCKAELLEKVHSISAKKAHSCRATECTGDEEPNFWHYDLVEQVW